MNEDFGQTSWWSLWMTDSYGNYFVAEVGLTFEESLEARDSKYGGQGIAAPGRYVTRSGDVLNAARVADGMLDEKVADLSSELTFGLTQLVSETPMYWSFARQCEEWVAEGKSPGRLSVAVDRVDGSLWTEQMQEQFLLDQRPDW